MLQLALLLSLVGGPISLRGEALRQQQPEPSLSAIYAVAVARLLGDAAEQEFFILPTSAQSTLTERARAASGEPRRAGDATARDVAARLATHYRGSKGMREKLARGDELQLVLGELRFEPARNPTFARLVIGVVGAGGSQQSMEFLLKRETAGWRVLKWSRRTTSDRQGARRAGPAGR